MELQFVKLQIFKSDADAQAESQILKHPVPHNETADSAFTLRNPQSCDSSCQTNLELMDRTWIWKKFGASPVTIVSLTVGGLKGIVGILHDQGK